MRKIKIIGWVYLLVTMLLVACASEEKDANPSEEKPTKAEENKDKQLNKEEIEKAQKQIADAFPERLTELAKTYGFLFDEIDFYEADFEIGIAYATLVDFNDDGVEELITLHKGGEYFDTPYEHRLTDDYVLEIFGSDLKEPKEIHVQNIPVQDNDDLSLGLISLKDGTTAYYERTVQTEQGTETETTVYHAMEQAGSFNKKTFTVILAKEKTFKIDDKEVDEATYKKELAKYDGKDKPIIQSENGQSAFAFQETSSGQMVADILAHFDQHTKEIVAAGEEVEASTIQEAVEKMLDLSSLDINNPSEMEQRLTYIMFYQGFDPDRPSFDIFAGVSEEQIAEKYQRLFGVPLDVKDAALPTPSAEEFPVIAYEDGVFYILPTDFYGLTVIRNIKQATKLPNDLYYVEVRDLEFNDYVYTLVVGYDQRITEQFLDRPYEEWPKEMRAYTKSNIPRYIVLKMVDGELTFRHIGYKPLTLEEIQAYE
jgi:hypothetical protein